MTRIAVVLPRLVMGGQELVCLKLVRAWLARGIDVDLVVGRADPDSLDQIPSGTRLFEISPRNPFLFPLGLCRYVRKQAPSHVVAAGYDAVAISLLLWRWFRPEIPLVVSIHNHTTKALSKKRGLWNKCKAHHFYRALHHAPRDARAVIAVSAGVAEDISCRIPELSGLVQVVENPIIDDEILRLVEKPLKGCPVPQHRPWIVFVGRLVPAKGADLLIEAFRLVASNRVLDLVIVGGGPEERRLREQAIASGLSGRVHFVGPQRNPFPWMRDAGVLVLSSWYEGFGNVLVEAMVCGTQIVATDCPSGPHEALAGGRYGQLVPVGMAQDMAVAVERSLSGEFHVEANALRARAMDYTADKAASRYLEVLGVLT
jgi:glycosyltransferase involved in cell wall biosynthesis